ncbi:MAG: DnaJ C-terminal domain-containing protein [Nannocystaceae bacterium]
MTDLYQTLGVAKDADARDIKRKYRKLTQKYHPDKNPGNNQAEEKFKDVSTAYDVLGDPDRRKLYDEFGDMSLTQGFDPERARAYKQSRSGFGGGGGGFPGGMNFSNYGDASNANFDDILSQLFGGGRVRSPDGMGGMGGRGRPRKGHNIEGEITVKFLNALHGTSVPLRVESQHGGSQTLDVRVPQGMADGGKLRVRGKGGAGNPPGDIILTVHVKSHPQLRRDGANLHMDVPISAYEAYRGGPIDVPTPWGTVTVKLPAGAQSGQKMRLRGKGVKVTRRDPGDLFLHLQIKMPAAGDEELLARLEALQSEEDVRTRMQFES